MAVTTTRCIPQKPQWANNGMVLRRKNFLRGDMFDSEAFRQAAEREEKDIQRRRRLGLAYLKWLDGMGLPNQKKEEPMPAKCLEPGEHEDDCWCAIGAIERQARQRRIQDEEEREGAA